MPYDDRLWRAIADYAVQFPTLESLGTDASDWATEYARVRRTAFASVLITANGDSGGNASGSRNFPQETLIDALHCRRFDLDSEYVLPPHLATYAAEKAARARGSRGFTLRFGY